MTKLLDLINQSNFAFYFLVVDASLDINLPDVNNFHLIYANKSNPVANSGQLLSQPQVQHLIQSTSGNRQVVIVPFKPSAKIDLLCSKHHWLVAANPASINRFFEDKIKFVRLCHRHKLPIIASSIDSFNQANFTKYRLLYGNNMVIQTHFGWAGKSTYSFPSWQAASIIIPSGTPVKYAPLLSGYTLTNNCCLTRFGLLQSPPALQYTGIKPFTTNPFATIGRQWPSFAPPKIVSQIKSITHQFSQVLANYNFKGWFGLDFFISDQQVYLLECNPRLTASFAFYTQLELSQNWTPLFYYHLAEFINLDYTIALDQENLRFTDQKISGSEITIRDHQGKTTTKHQFDYPLFSQVQPIHIDPHLISTT